MVYIVMQAVKNRVGGKYLQKHVLKSGYVITHRFSLQNFNYRQNNFLSGILRVLYTNYLPSNFDSFSYANISICVKNFGLTAALF